MSNEPNQTLIGALRYGVPYSDWKSAPDIQFADDLMDEAADTLSSVEASLDWIIACAANDGNKDIEREARSALETLKRRRPQP